MQTTFASLSVGAGVLGIAVSALYRRKLPWITGWKRLRSAGLIVFPVAGAVLLAILFLVALQSKAPFSPGQTLAWGLLIGGAIGWIAALDSAGSAVPEPVKPDDGDSTGSDVKRQPFRSMALLSMAVIGPGVVFLLFPGYPNEALAGVAIGTVLLAAVCASSCLPLVLAGREEETATALSRGMEVYATAVSVVAAGCLLGIAHFPRLTPESTAGAYRVVPCLLMAAGALALPLWPAHRVSSPLPGLLAGGVVTAASFAIGARLLPELDGWPVLAGFAAFAVVIAVYSMEERDTRTDPYQSALLGFGGGLLVLSVVAFAYRQSQAYGQALAMLPALPFLAIAYLQGSRANTDLEKWRPSAAGTLGMASLQFALLLTLYRVFIERMGRGRAFDFQQQYDLLAFLLAVGAGIAVPALLAGGAARVRDSVTHAAGTLLGRSVLLLAGAIGLPLLLGLLSSERAEGAFLAGLAVSMLLWITLAAWARGLEHDSLLHGMTCLPFLSSVWVAVQATTPALALHWTREGKMTALAVVTLVGLTVIAVDAFRPKPAPLPEEVRR